MLEGNEKDADHEDQQVHLFITLSHFSLGVLGWEDKCWFFM